MKAPDASDASDAPGLEKVRQPTYSRCARQVELSAFPAEDPAEPDEVVEVAY